jgi:hypothetical protein
MAANECGLGCFWTAAISAANSNALDIAEFKQVPHICQIMQGGEINKNCFYSSKKK